MRIIYPPGAGQEFDWDHYFAVHLPMGLRLLKEHKNVVPTRVEIETRTSGPAPDVPSFYQCGCALFFETRDDVDKMIGLFDIEVAANEMRGDWPNYTDVEPELLISEIVDVPV